MPDPRLFVLGLAVASVASLLIVRALTGLSQDATAVGRWRRAAWLGLLAGLAAGWNRLGYVVPWPPATGLDRLLLVTLPAVLAVELLVGSRVVQGLTGGITNRLPGIPREILPALSLGLVSMAVPLVLLWGSVHLGGEIAARSLSGQGSLLLASGSLLGLGVASLRRVSLQPQGWTVPISLMLALLTAGICILLAGYIKGGAVAFPLAGTLLGGLLATSGPRSVPVTAHARDEVYRALVTFGTVSLYGVLLVGCAFGRLPGGRALLVGFAPLLGGVTAWAPPGIRRGRWFPWGRLTLIAVPLGMALFAAKHDFDRTLGPLVGRSGRSPLAGDALEDQAGGIRSADHPASGRLVFVDGNVQVPGN